MMTRVRQALGHCEAFDSLYVSPHWDDVALACAARLLRDRQGGRQALIVNLFGAGPEECRVGDKAELARRLTDLGATHLSADMPEARKRSDKYSTFQALASGREPADEECLHQAVDILTDVVHVARPREIFAPLALGGHIDHRLSHEAARAAFAGGDGRNVFFYEERPEAFLRGAVRLRLGALGVRLPPAARAAAERALLPRFLLGFSVAPAFRGDLEDRLGKLKALGIALRQWRAGWTWDPSRAMGPRLQPVLYPSEPGIAEQVRTLLSLPPSLQKEAEAYASRLGAASHAERYWLLLPPREADGLETLHGPGGEAPRLERQ